MITGQRIIVTVNGRVARATVVLGSDNRKSLLVSPDSGLSFGDGIYIGAVPLLTNEVGAYENPVTGTPVTLEWDEEEKP